MGQYFLFEKERILNMSDGIKQKISEALDLPKDIVLNLSRITITGNIAVFIENHKGIVEYKNDLIRINTSTGTLSVSGQGLLIKTILQDEICIEGKIKAIEFEE